MTRPLPVTLFDYGAGNLHSIEKALVHGGADVTVTQDGRDLLDAEAIVLPGVGAFGACMAPLEPVRVALRDKLLSGTPCLAVCIGMQLLFERSEEAADVPGIAFFQGDIKRFSTDAGKVPHMGWNALHGPTVLPRWDSRAGAGMAWEDMLPGHGAHVYYVHSYYAIPTEPVTLRATTYGTEYAAVVARGNTMATQFHPEKSSGIGLEIVGRWVRAATKHLADQPEAKP